MHKAAVVFVLLLACSSCVVPALNTLWTPDKGVYEPALLGQWAEPDSKVTYRFLEADGESYGLIVTNAEGKASNFICNLVQLGPDVLLDMYPAEIDTMFEAYAPWHILPLHSFYLLKLAGDELIVTTLNPEWLMEYVGQHPEAIGVAQWQYGGSDSIPLLTASTAQLQEFIANNVDTPEAFYAETHLARSSE